ncbi:MAG: hypothetical protein NTV36_01275 [Candidatus Staskawiczbacteria bacterium]|nr:hypothetical protein [Candidatus Staskawiczbacteria bacterium]
MQFDDFCDELSEKIRAAISQLRAGKVSKETVDLLGQLGDMEYGRYEFCANDISFAESKSDEEWTRSMANEASDNAGKYYNLAGNLEELI